MNSRAQISLGNKPLYWGLMLIIFTVILLVFTFVVVHYTAKINQVSPYLKAHTLSLRFTTLPECLAAVDSLTGAVSSGVLDLSKFNENHLRGNCFPTISTQDYNFILKLKRKDISISTLHYRDTIDYTFLLPVLVQEGADLSADNLEIGVQVKI